MLGTVKGVTGELLAISIEVEAGALWAVARGPG